MFISATRILRKAAFSLGSRWRARLRPATKEGEEDEGSSGCVVGMPSGLSQIGGDEAFGERTAEGIQVCNWMDLKAVGGGGEGDLPPFLPDGLWRMGYSL